MKIIFTLVAALATFTTYAQTIKYVAKESFKIKAKTEPISDVVSEIKKGDTLNIIGYEKTYWIVNFKDKTGYVSELWINENPDLAKIKKAYADANPGFIRKKNTQLKIGNSKLDLMDIFGLPTETNVSKYAWGTHEQWVYRFQSGSVRYFYFEDNKLTSWSEI